MRISIPSSTGKAPASRRSSGHPTQLVARSQSPDLHERSDFGENGPLFSAASPTLDGLLADSAVFAGDQADAHSTRSQT